MVKYLCFIVRRPSGKEKQKKSTGLGMDRKGIFYDRSSSLLSIESLREIFWETSTGRTVFTSFSWERRQGVDKTSKHFRTYFRKVVFCTKVTPGRWSPGDLKHTDSHSVRQRVFGESLQTSLSLTYPLNQRISRAPSWPPVREPSLRLLVRFVEHTRPLTCQSFDVGVEGRALEWGRRS